MARVCVGVIALLIFSTLGWADETPLIRYEKGPEVYEIALLQLALDHTADEGPFRLENQGLDLSEDRAVISLNQGAFDVTFMVLTRQRERELLPIRIDLTRGIQGFRVFLIRKQDAAAFAEVKTLGELARFKAGFGAQWGDLGALTSNGLPVVTSAEGSRLYPMLAIGRFDYFPRGINEVWDNLTQHAAEAPQMMVEENLALFYPLVQCFVVAKTSQPLAARIERGLQMALSDGSMKRLFMKFHQQDLERAQIGHRRVLMLSNPDLPTGGPEVDPRWWLPSP